MTLEQILIPQVIKAVKELFAADITCAQVQLQKTVKNFQGDITLVVFPFVKSARKSPDETARITGEWLVANVPLVRAFNAVKGFLNLEIEDKYFVDELQAFAQNGVESELRGGSSSTADSCAVKTTVIEYSSPNTNKPLHLGHIRNNLLGWSVSEIVKAAGKNVVKVNLVNDRGIHICKSMLAWQKWGSGETPESSGIKGDHLVGKYYVVFNQKLSEQIKEAASAGTPEDEAERNAPLMKEAREMLLKWEQGDTETIALWKRMNEWVYAGFDETYRKLGVDFDKIYYESETYLLGKEIVRKGLEQGVLYKREDGSVWADLRDEGLDEKLLLRKDGTSVYMTQDLGTALLRHDEWKADELVYVVGNEQNYHFDVLKRVLRKLGYKWAEKITHLSYGMVELPNGKMKSREGTVVDADDLIAAMTGTARETTEALGKAAADETLYRAIALGALKYFILKVDPVKNMLFNPEESIDFNGNTGPFIQYTHARICSLLRKAEEAGTDNLSDNAAGEMNISEKEKLLASLLLLYPQAVAQAAEQFSPALIANTIYEIAKEFNGFYQETPVLKEENHTLKHFRLTICVKTRDVLKHGLSLLGIVAPERM
ncbi:MAG: arginine--tRNA ligase [Bacteroidales bacterium]|jgi:arginyl-tRNA synthetase|nr:arginine--tRNA ligase [Bacteroidales bacterium]